MENENGFLPRHAISRARFFIEKSEKCKVEDRNDFEAYMEAAIIFARSSLHRLMKTHEKKKDWKNWFNSFKGNVSIEFIKEERDFILKEASPKVGQIISGNKIDLAKNLYYYEDPAIPAIDTVKRHVEEIAKIVSEADRKFI